MVPPERNDLITRVYFDKVPVKGNLASIFFYAYKGYKDVKLLSDADTLDHSARWYTVGWNTNEGMFPHLSVTGFFDASPSLFSDDVWTLAHDEDGDLFWGNGSYAGSLGVALYIYKS